MSGVDFGETKVADPQRPRVKLVQMQWASAAKVAAPLALLAIVAAFALSTHGFLHIANLKSILTDASLTGIVAVAMTPMTLSGNFVSLGTQQSALGAAVLFIALINSGWAVVPALAAVIIGSVVVALLQGAFVSAGVNAVITTLASGGIIFGVVAAATGSALVQFNHRAVDWSQTTVLGVPIEGVVFLAVTCVMTILLSKTVAGRQTGLVGASRPTAELAGISFTRVTLAAFALFGVGIAISAIMYSTLVGEVSLQSFGTLTVDTIVAVLVGGTAIQGGYGSPSRSAGGAFLIATISNLMFLRGASTGIQQVVVGSVGLGAVVTLHIIRSRTVSK